MSRAIGGAFVLTLLCARFCHTSSQSHTSQETPLPHVLARPPDRQPLFVIGAGRGDTGTTTLHYLFCRLGLRTQHYSTSCNFPGDRSQVLKESGLGPLYSRFKSFRREVYSGLKHLDLAAQIDLFEKALDQLGQKAGSGDYGAGLVGDTPIPYFFNRLRRLKPGAPVINMVHSGRDGLTWAERRFHSGHGAHDIVCRAEFFSKLSNPFDVLECAQLGVRLSRTISEMFVTTLDMNNSQTDGPQHVGQAYSMYSDHVRKESPQRYLEIDVFNCCGVLDKEQLLFHRDQRDTARCNLTDIEIVVAQFVQIHRFAATAQVT